MNPRILPLSMIALVVLLMASDCPQPHVAQTDSGMTIDASKIITRYIDSTHGVVCYYTADSRGVGLSCLKLLAPAERVP